MSHAGLFSSLSGYSQNPCKLSIENFTTELLAYLFNHDLVFRRRFLDIIFPSRAMAYRFENAEASTQQALGRDCRVDLVLHAGDRTHLIEVKISAAETQSSRWGQTGKPQISRYIDLGLGHVTYLTTRDSLAPEVDGRGRKFRLIKHALFENLYGALEGARRTRLTEMFLEFMEEQGMTGPHPFSRRELNGAEQTFGLYGKCLRTMEMVRTEVNNQFRRNLKTYARLTRPSFRSGPDWCYVGSYLNGYRRGAVNFVGMGLEPWEGSLHFHVFLWGNLHPSIARIRKHLGWEKWDEERGCCSHVRLRGSRADVSRMIAHAIEASRDLGRAIRRFA